MANEKSKSVFETLNAVDCSKYVEKKGALTYLSWAWAWGQVKKYYPQAVYRIYEDGEGRMYHTDGKTAWVKTGVEIEGIEYIEYLPVMDNRHNSIPVANVKSTDANTAVQRSLTKACARHGLGLYIYAGEDLPEEVKEQREAEKAALKEQQVAQAIAEAYACTDLQQVGACWKKWAEFRSVEAFAKAIKEVGEPMKKGGAA